MSNPFAFADDLGPEKVIEIYDPKTSLKAVLVVDNVAMGPSIGGVRMAPDGTVAECFRLARAMTLKNAAASLAHGGGKSIIIANPQTADKERLIRSFAHAIADIVDYIPGPDMGTNEAAMAWVKDVCGRSVGLPREVGGIPLDEIGATGYGLAVALEVAQDHCDVRLDGATVVVQGYGSVGRHAARFLAEQGARLVGVSDSSGARSMASGFNLKDLAAFKLGGGRIVDYPHGEPIADLVDVPCDIWIPAARPDVLTAENAGRLKAKIVAQGANIPATPEAEQLLASAGVLILPDFVANAGGVICAAVEYHGGTQSQALATIRDRISANVSEVLATAAQQQRMTREVAVEIAVRRVRTAMSYRRTA